MGNVEFSNFESNVGNFEVYPVVNSKPVPVL